MGHPVLCSVYVLYDIYICFFENKNTVVVKLCMNYSTILHVYYTGCPTRYRTHLAGGPLLRGATIRRTTDPFLFISHTTNVLLFKFRCNIFIGIRIVKEMPGSVASGTHCISMDDKGYYGLDECDIGSLL